MSKKLVGLIAFLALVLSACGQQNADNASSSFQIEQNQGTYNWKTEEWRRGDGSYVGGTFYVEKNISGLEYQADQEYDSRFSQYRCWGANFYSLDKFSSLTDSSTPVIWYINGYEDAAGEIWHRRVELPETEEYGGTEKRISSFDILSPKEYVLFVQILNGNEILAYLAMRFSMEGEYRGAFDLYPIMQTCEGSVLTSSSGGMFFGDVYVDCEEHYFFVANDRVAVFDGAGEPLAELAWDKEDSSGSFAMKTAEGEPVFNLYSNASQEGCLVMYDSAAGQGKFFTPSLPHLSSKGISGDGLFYYGDEGRLYRWDLRTGDEGVCFNYEESGLGRNSYMTLVAVSEEGFPLILDRSREKAIICKLGPEPGQEGESVLLVSLVKDNSFISSSAVMFSQEQGEHPVSVQQPEGSLADFRTRAMADLVAGKGADIYYVSGADMRTLYEKGVLADLSDTLDEELRESLYNGAISCGVIDGRQIGLPVEAYVTTLLVSGELWEKESWTLAEALAVMEEHPEFEKLLTSRRYMAKSTALRLLLLQDLPNSPFLDMDAGVCDFNNELFIKALEIVGDATGDNDPPSIMKDGRAASFRPNTDSFADFSAEMSVLGEGFYPVGFPTEAGNGSYWNADYFLVVSDRTKQREVIDAYLNSLYSLARQSELSCPVRNDIVEKNIYYMDDYMDTSLYEHPWKYSIGGGRYEALHTKPDGSPWTAEYRDILDKALPRCQSTYYIEDIILEEAATYLSKVKTAEQVAETIQNRVQLYLNEQQ